MKVEVKAASWLPWISWQDSYRDPTKILVLQDNVLTVQNYDNVVKAQN